MAVGLSGKRVLVTGAGGFIPSHLVERLVHEGCEVRAFVHYNSRYNLGCLRFISPDILESVDLVFGDLKDSSIVLDVMEDVDTVFHLGALISIPYSYTHPREVVETNVIGTLNVLMGSRMHNVRRIVHTSTSEVYGTAIRVPMNECHPLQGQSPYSASKIGADKLVESFYDSYDVPTVTIRPFNTYGPRQLARAVIPTIVSQALLSNHIRLGNLTPTRDFTYVTDTVEGFVNAGVCNNIVGETINLGSGEEISVGQLVDLVTDLIGSNLEVESESERMRPQSSEVNRLLSDNSKAKDLLGWEPKVSLRDGLLRTIDWIRDNPDMFTPGRYQI